MPLPPPNTGARWKDFEISTPTFQLSPIEKPDMSPFLVHMTGKNEIKNILEGQRAPAELPERCGYLQANVPDNTGGNYRARVVCFTESPTFSLDFFRYRSFRRWQNDQRFGLGFDKSNLVTRGVRPVIYVDQPLLRDIIALNAFSQEFAGNLIERADLNGSITDLIRRVYPLLFPLLENEARQGFMWEREWRYPEEVGFIFGHHEIKIICCPQEEEAELRELLGDLAHNIAFIRTWEEYDDVTDYLRRQQSEWIPQERIIKEAPNLDVAIGHLSGLIDRYTIALNSLDSYRSFITQLSDVLVRLDEERSRLTNELLSAQEKIKDLEKKKEEKN